MAFLDNLGKRMTSSMDLSRLQSAVNDEERRRKDLYCAIGEQYATLHKEDPEEALAGLINEVKASFDRSDEYRRLIRQMKGWVQCPNCGADMEPTIRFCIQCGAKMPQPEPQMASGKFCMFCGAPLTEGAKFCYKCGQPAQQVQSPVGAPKLEVEAVPVEADPISEEPAVAEEVSELIKE